jgi:NAD(P)-dependent dehydrogenase (short-subunit alcohol dehydrogenase family)
MESNRKVAVITGAAGGIGAAAAGLFLEHDWDVVSLDRAEIRTPCALTIRADLSRLEDLERAIAQVKSVCSRIDALINNAAEQLAKSLIETEPAEWDALMSTNARAVYLLMSRFYPLLKPVKGCIVNIASIHALATSPGIAAYAASKGALVALTRAVALEFANVGIRVNAVLPGAIDTPMLAAGLTRPGQSLQALAAKHPLGRIGRPEEIAEAIYFLADSDRSSFITGQTLVVDGGASARLSTE